jgi:hypothetical protein
MSKRIVVWGTGVVGKNSWVPDLGVVTFCESRCLAAMGAVRQARCR